MNLHEVGAQDLGKNDYLGKLLMAAGNDLKFTFSIKGKNSIPWKGK